MAGVNAVQKLTPKHFLVVHLDHNFYLWYPGVVGGLFHSWISHFISIVETFKYVLSFPFASASSHENRHGQSPVYDTCVNICMCV